MKRALDIAYVILLKIKLQFPAVLITLLAVYAFYGMDVGRDIALGIHDDLYYYYFFLTAAFLFCYEIWRGMREIEQKKKEEKSSSSESEKDFRLINEWFPRGMGVVGLSVLLGLNLLPHCGATASFLLSAGMGLAALILSNYIIRRNNFLHEINLFSVNRYTVFLSIGCVAIVTLGILGYYDETHFYYELALTLVWGVTFGLFAIPRNFITGLQKLIAILRWVVGVLTGALMLLAIFWIDFTLFIGPAAVAVLGFTSLAGIGQLLTRISIGTRWNYHWVALGATVAVSLVLGNGFLYDTRTLPRRPDAHSDYVRPTAEAFFTQWVEHRQDSILARNEAEGYPVVLVMTHGGALKSGLWTGEVLRQLDSLTGHRAQDHLLAMSGASGGNVGTAAWWAALAHRHVLDTVKAARVGQHVHTFLSQDFLSYPLARFLLLDVIRHPLPVPFHDRAAALEKGMEQLVNKDGKPNPVGSTFAQDIQEIFAKVKPGVLPALFLNSTRLQDARPSVISNVLIDSSFGGQLDVLGTMPPEQSLRLSTSVVLTARFPYVSPAGNLCAGAFVDGGYFDNAGAGTLQNFMEVVVRTTQKRRLAGGDAPLYKRLRFYVLHIEPDRPSGEIAELNPLINDLAAPLLTLANSYGSQTTFAINRIKKFMVKEWPEAPGLQVNYLRLNLLDAQDNFYKAKKSPTDSMTFELGTPSLPMNWYISKSAQQHITTYASHCVQTDTALGSLRKRIRP